MTLMPNRKTSVPEVLAAHLFRRKHRTGNGATRRNTRRSRGSRRYWSSRRSRESLGRGRGSRGWRLLVGMNPVTRFPGTVFLPRKPVFPHPPEGLKVPVTWPLLNREVHVDKHIGDGGRNCAAPDLSAATGESKVEVDTADTITSSSPLAKASSVARSSSSSEESSESSLAG